MISSKVFSHISKALMILAVTLSMACSVPSDSSTASNTNTTESQSLAFSDCVISSVLKGVSMDDSKTSCLLQAEKVCDSNPATKDTCLEIVSKATQKVMDDGEGVDCDSGYCTITYR